MFRQIIASALILASTASVAFAEGQVASLEELQITNSHIISVQEVTFTSEAYRNGEISIHHATLNNRFVRRIITVCMNGVVHRIFGNYLNESSLTVVYNSNGTVALCPICHH